MTHRSGCPDCARANAAPGGPGLTRRAFLARTAGVAAASLVGLSAPQLTTRVAFAASPTYTGDVLVVVSFRGGFDGLSAVAPLGDPGYAAARPTIAVPPSRALPTGDRFWGLHPALAPLLPWWQAGTFGAVHAVGAPDPTRSHFSAMAEMERAAPGSSLRTGWIDRALGLRPATGTFQGMSVGSATVPQSMSGPFAELGLDSLDGFTLDGVWGDTAEQKAADLRRWSTALAALHAGVPSMSTAATSALGAIATARTLADATYTPANGARYPHTVDGGPFEGSPLSAALLDVARLVRADVGLQLVCIDYGDWDMHADLGTVDRGRFHGRLAEWAASVAAFAADLGTDGMRDVTLLTMSEFGRRVAENGDRGTDHGHGNAMLLLGGGVAGGTVHGPWPGLAPERLDDGDLAGTTDYRDVLAEVLTRRCGQSAADLTTVFPGRGAFAGVGAVVPRT